ncbi:cation transport protein-domain-containing protein [Naematelia encephala]|uniref:Potassium transport protein n=1 Tax=Naematelia encephala TaxID=71784 RepID=A0A1Y2B8R3_9TREE|nr:cation transport protein-domain-containing protein [Naematelia encephala]
MPKLPKHLKVPSKASKVLLLIQSQLNFYRVHIMSFTIVPLVFSAIMWACNTEYQIEYIDCLFVCMSSMTVTGLATINLSTLSVFQQVLLFIQMVIGSTTFVSIIMIVVRRHFFRSTFKHAIKEHQKRQRRRPSFNLQKTFTRVASAAPAPLTAIKRRFGSVSKEDNKEAHEMNGRDSAEHSGTPSSVEPKHEPNSHIPDMRLPEPAAREKEKKKHGGKKKQISKGMIRRVEGGGVGMVNPMGWYDTERPLEPRTDEPPPLALPASDVDFESREEESHPRGLGLQRQPRINEGEVLELEPNPRFLDDPIPRMVSSSPPPMDPGESPPSKTPYAGKTLTDEAFPRSKTIAFDDADDGMDHVHHDRGMTTARDGGFFPRTATARSQRGEAGVPRTGTVASFPRTYSLRPTVSRQPADPRLSGFGGFPTPFEVARTLAKRFAPETSRTLTKSLTIQRTNTITGRGTLASQDAIDGKEVPYISFSAVVGRNSQFKGLTEEQMEELGGVEYRALKVLLIIVITYFVFVQLAAFVIIAPYINAGGRYDHVFNDQPRLVTIPWFSLFQSVSAYTNTGMSLVDLSMLPFQRAYLMIVVLIILIFAGNTAFPVFLRLTVWSIYKLVPTQSRVRETLKFLLDHPRRCFIYLFPATQTWVLALVMLSLYMTDWVSFLVLDIGTSTIQSIPVGTRIASGFLQSAAVRAAGFAIVPVNSLAPAVKVLYVIMMYISVYPIALSVRSTNVYEEKSLGLFNEEEDDEWEPDEKGAQAVAKYLGWHARRQLAFDIWWLGFALWLVCIIERRHLNDAADYEWFNIFNIIFELVSAYGTVGLSLGVGNDNYSLSGSFRKLSKLVVCVVMLRGRHRGLPVAIDRAVMLPRDFTAQEEEEFEEERSRRMSRRESAIISEDAINSFRRGSGTISQSQPPPEHSPTAAPPLPLSHRRDSLPASTSQPLRREVSPGSSPSPGPKRSNSLSATPGSPAQLSFALSRASGERQRSPVAFKGASSSGTGGLTPVRENTMSRAQTKVEDDESAVE